MSGVFVLWTLTGKLLIKTLSFGFLPDFNNKKKKRVGKLFLGTICVLRPSLIPASLRVAIKTAN